MLIIPLIFVISILIGVLLAFFSTHTFFERKKHSLSSANTYGDSVSEEINSEYQKKTPKQIRELYGEEEREYHASREFK